MPENIDILLIEDNPLDAQITMQIFKDHHLSDMTLWVKNGEEALDYMFARNSYKDRAMPLFPKVIILDLRLPQTGGIEVLRQIRSDRRTQDVSVVVVTISDEEKDMLESYKLGIDCYMTKPIDFNYFAKVILELIKDKPSPNK